MIKGFDTAARLNADQAERMRILGYEYAIRYIVPQSNSKSLTKDEAEGLLSAGLAVGLCWETTADRAKSGAVGGLADGKAAKECAAAVGVPSNTVIYFAVDYNAQPNDYDAISAYMIAAASACRPYRLGVYGCYAVVEEMHRRGIGVSLWQCVAWSGGKWSDHAAIQQREWNVKTPVVTVDNNYAHSTDGMWTREATPMFYSFTPSSMGIYHNINKKTINQIKDELGCDIICNLNLFNSNWTGACYTRADGVVVGTDGWGYFGFGFDRYDRTMSRGWSGEDRHDNFFGCWDIIMSGRRTDDSAPTWTAGYRRRTVIGTLGDGKVFIYCNPTIESVDQLANNLLSRGVIEAIVLDGGGSTQCITPISKVVSSDKTPRKVHTLFWANLTEKKPKCPYTEPTGNVRWGSIGQGAKWVQWYLNQHGAKLSVDGIFGGKSVAALKAFQQQNGLVADGICGILTRAKLKS